MPTPEAMDAAAEFLWPLYTDKNMPRSQFALGNDKCQRLALAFDRFAAQRGAEAPSMEAVKARLATYQPLGSRAKGVAGPAIAPDELSERDGADPTQMGGGDAPELETADCIITIELRDKDAERACELYDALEGLLWKMGDIGLLSMRTEHPQTGGGDAGERARKREDGSVFITLENLPGFIFIQGVEGEGIEPLLVALDQFLSLYTPAVKAKAHREGAEEARQDALRAPFTKALVAEARTQGYREGAEAMREDCIAEVRSWVADTGGRDTGLLRALLRALPMPGKIDAT